MHKRTESNSGDIFSTSDATTYEELILHSSQ